MITHLSGTVTFPINGVVLDLKLSGQPGITAIVGENGSGKTFLGSELPRYLLFGKKALRGLAADYKALIAEGSFIIAGKVYHIKRSAKEEQITDAAGTVLAVGADAVTTECEKLLGYGLEVFDICNASPQKKADMFGRMLPSKRKQLLDRVLHLTSNEKVEKMVRAEAAALKREAEALTRQLREPVLPDEPQGYVQSESLQHMIEHARVARAKRDAITARIKPVAFPVEPKESRPVADVIERLEKAEAEYHRNSAERARLQDIIRRGLPFNNPEWDEEQLTAAEARLAAKSEIERRGPKPTYPLRDLEIMTGRWAEVRNYNEKPSENVTCPKCSHTFETRGAAPLAPSITMETIVEQRRAHTMWEDGDVTIPAGPDLTRQQIDHARQGLALKEAHDEAARQLDALPVHVSSAATLTMFRQRIAEWAAYDTALANAEKQEQENAEAKAELIALGTVVTQETIDGYADKLTEAKVYEAAKARYATEMADFTRLSTEIADKTKMAEEYAKGGTALAEARAEVKSFLAPALSRVASAIVSEMTLGKLNSIVVDDDVEITVNAQRLETLSGAGETVANIALRIALGQVLVANTFPVFIGDEMDSDADDQRRQATAEAIRNLMDSGRLKQIILITHRGSDIADRTLNLNVTG